uniref:Uncharacterized protein n=1 Tax=Anopheles maculatus TaxID=74869 RepID=A0A182TAX7_9DIPT
MAIRSLRYMASVGANVPKPVTCIGIQQQQHNIARCISAQLAGGSTSSSQLWSGQTVRFFSGLQGEPTKRFDRIVAERNVSFSYANQVSPSANILPQRDNLWTLEWLPASRLLPKFRRFTVDDALG